MGDVRQDETSPWGWWVARDLGGERNGTEPSARTPHTSLDIPADVTLCGGAAQGEDGAAPQRADLHDHAELALHVRVLHADAVEVVWAHRSKTGCLHPRPDLRKCRTAGEREEMHRCGSPNPERTALEHRDDVIVDAVVAAEPKGFFHGPGPEGCKSQFPRPSHEHCCLLSDVHTNPTNIYIITP